jgi:hypothetical protein
MIKIGLILGLVGWALSTLPALAAVNNWKKSATLVAKSTGDYGTDNFRTSILSAKKDNFNWITLVIPLYQDNIYSVDIYKGWNTPTDETLKSAVSFIHSQNMGVTLKIHLEPNDGQWRALLAPWDRNRWFGSYSYWLNYYGNIGKQSEAEQMIIGAELYNMTSPKVNGENTSKWKSMIGSLKGNYFGQLGYSAQRADNAYSEMTEIGFWGDLNHIGVSGYYPLATWTYNPTVADIVNSWSGIEGQYFKPLYNQYQKPFEFTEIGYRSVNGNHYHPYDWSSNDGVNLTEQKNLYEGLFQYWNTQNYLTGVHLWDWSTNPNDGGNNDSNYTPQNKPAETVIAQWFGNSGGSTPSPTLVPSTPPVNATFSVSGSSQPNPVVVNQNTTINILVTSNAAVAQKIVNLEIYNQSGNRVAQQYWENTAFEANLAKTFSFNWQTGTQGTFRVAVGIFNSGWSGLNLWEDQATLINVGQAEPTNTPTPTVTPTGQPTPTNTPAPEPTPQPTSTPAPEPTEINIWWPTDGVSINGVNPFKAMVSNMDINQYKMWWSVDGGSQNEMGDSQTDYPHKESLVDVQSWNWNGNGPYKITFTASKHDGVNLGQKTVNINITR